MVVSLEVRNTGDRTGDEVVQLYIRDDVASVEEPIKELKGARRVTLQPSETRTVTFVLKPDAFALYDHEMRRVVEPGTFTIFAGTNSVDVTSLPLQVTGDVLVLAPSTPRMR